MNDNNMQVKPKYNIGDIVYFWHYDSDVLAGKVIYVSEEIDKISGEYLYTIVDGPMLNKEVSFAGMLKDVHESVLFKDKHWAELDRQVKQTRTQIIREESISFGVYNPEAIAKLKLNKE